MKILVTGSAGRIGRAIVKCCRAHHDVVGFDLKPSPFTDVCASLADDGALRRAMRGCAAVIHTAALHAPHVGQADDATFMRVNFHHTQALLAAAVDAGVRQIVYTSTTALYGSASTPPDRAGWVTESLKVDPITIYHRSKLAAEMLLAGAAERGLLAVTILRMSRCFPEPAPRMAIYRLHRGIDARDVATAHLLALRPCAAPLRRFVVSGSTPFLPEDCALLRVDAPTVLRQRAPDLVAAFATRGWPLPPAIDRVYVADLAARELGWRAQFGYDAVLDQLDSGSDEVLPADAD